MSISPDQSHDTETATASDQHTARSDSPAARPNPLIAALPEIALLLFSGVLLARTIGMTGNGQGPGPALYPRILLTLLAVTMVVRIAVKLRAARGGARDHASEEADEAAGASLPLVAQAIGLAVGFVTATVYLGWPLATFIFVPLFCWIVGRRNLLVSVPLGAVLSLGSAFVFVRFVYIALPTGVGVFDELTVQLYIALGIY